MSCRKKMWRIAGVSMAAALSVVITTGTANAAPALPGTAYAAGAGTAADSFTNKEFKVGAFRDPGGHAYGYAYEKNRSSRFGDFTLQGPVDCLFISGRTAYVGMRIALGTGTAAAHQGERFVIAVQDNGPLGQGDRFDNSGFINPSSGCSPPSSTNNLGQHLTSGDVVVSSSSPRELARGL